MTYTILLFVTRSQSLTSDEFRDYYEHKHIPLARSLVGAYWPKSFRRQYFARVSRKGFGGPANRDRPPLMLRGDMQDLDCDCIAEMNFASEKIFQKFYSAIYEKENAAVLAEDEKMFLEPGKTKVVVVGESWSTDENGVTTSEIGCAPRLDRSDSDTSTSGQS
ncbi:EthD domain-containing protein [Pyrenochaeta sp. MPI-SDFR-AT-0127]|nr:EthD domain-containing protein [Pyrenochaeta sp. MPI-SDFR-AT-0127]